MNKKNLKSEMILNKKFETELSGYNAKEVDVFLDLILNDYKQYEESEKISNEKINDLTKIISDRDELIEALKLEKQNLEQQNSTLSENTNVELSKRIQMLESKLRDK